ncbi:helix-turn-helix domain-containing protein [Nonomuraea lactucae]|uniref:helix-turn-helix domain-containing protein n=1 Tax=Nonomuraea lactucae TaxID=2249762 RepID=UPI000DE3045B|nr:helix-turn-helix domain-containing protein [Nonomuraea lactucae]
MSVTAADVIGEVLDRGGSPADVLAALAHAGMPVLEPLDELEPGWLPTTRYGLQLVRHAARLTAEGQTCEEIAAELNKSTRSVQRYLAAAVHYGLLYAQRRQRSRW